MSGKQVAEPIAVHGDHAEMALHRRLQLLRNDVCDQEVAGKSLDQPQCEIVEHAARLRQGEEPGRCMPRADIARGQRPKRRLDVGSVRVDAVQQPGPRVRRSEFLRAADQPGEGLVSGLGEGERRTDIREEVGRGRGQDHRAEVRCCPCQQSHDLTHARVVAE